MKNSSFIALFFYILSFHCSAAKIESSNAQSDNPFWYAEQVIILKNELLELKYETKINLNANNERLDKLNIELKKLHKELQYLQGLGGNHKTLELDITQKLKTEIRHAKELSTKELEGHKSLVLNIDSNVKYWGILLSAFALFITIAGVFLGLSARARAIVEARAAAEDWIQSKSKDISQELTQKLKNSEVVIKTLESHLNNARNEIDAHSKKIIESRKLIDEFTRELPVPNSKEADALVNRATQEVASSDLLENSPDDLYAKAVKAFYSSEHIRALELLDKALAISDLTDVVVLNLLFLKGNVYSSISSYVEAVDVYDTLIEKFSDNNDNEIVQGFSAALRNKGIALGGLGKSQDAIDVYDTLIDRFSDNQDGTIPQDISVALNNKDVELGKLD